MDTQLLAGILLFGLPLWLAIIIWVWRKVFKIRSLWD